MAETCCRLGLTNPIRLCRWSAVSSKIQTIFIGQALFIAALLFAGVGHSDRLMVTIGLTLLGLGWSASTVAGSALLTSTLPADEKTNVQGLSDSLMNLSGAFGGAVAGLLLASLHFEGLNAIALVPVAVITVLAFFISKRNQLANS